MKKKKKSFNRQGCLCAYLLSIFCMGGSLLNSYN